jgi:hypothetical protein
MKTMKAAVNHSSITLQRGFICFIYAAAACRVRSLWLA